MLNFLECIERNVLKVTGSGKWDHADQAAFFEHVGSLFEKRGKVRVLWELKDGQGRDGRTDWHDPTLVLRYRDEVSRLAIVGEEKDLPNMAWMVGAFVNVRLFRPTERDEAWRWVTAGVEENAKKECIRRLAYSKYRRQTGLPATASWSGWKRSAKSRPVWAPDRSSGLASAPRRRGRL